MVRRPTAGSNDRDERQPAFFSRFAHRTAEVVGTPYVFMVAVLLVVVWAASGPVFGFSSTWQLVINTGTTIITFLMVFLIQSSQNRDSRALHLKLDAIIDAFDEVREDMVDVEDASDEELEAAREHFKRRREAHGETGSEAGAQVRPVSGTSQANGARTDGQ